MSQVKNDKYGNQFIVKADLSTIIDEAGAGVTYVGKAAPGTATTEAKWLIKKIDESVNPITILFATNDSNVPTFDKVWDDRAGLVYS